MTDTDYCWYCKKPSARPLCSFCATSTAARRFVKAALRTGRVIGKDEDVKAAAASLSKSISLSMQKRKACLDYANAVLGANSSSIISGKADNTKEME